MITNFWYLLFGYVGIAPLSESYKVYVLNKEDIKPIDGVIHIIKDDTTANIREKFTKQRNNFLREPKIIKNYKRPYKVQTHMKNKNDIRNYIDSPVVYTNGRYTLNLDKINVRNEKEVTNSLNNKEYDHLEDNFRDFSEYISISERLRSNNKIPWDHLKHLSKFLRNDNNLRKYNKIFIGDKKFRADDGNLYSLNILRKKKRIPKKRFSVIDNNKDNSKSSSNENDNYSNENDNYSNENDNNDNDNDDTNNSNDNDDDSPRNKLKPNSAEVSNTDESESYEYDDGVYLQGNTLIKVKGNGDQESENNDDFRRRQQQFLPKRFHWDKKDYKQLGYYWFNGVQGKYPSPEVLY